MPPWRSVTRVELSRAYRKTGNMNGTRNAQGQDQPTRRVRTPAGRINESGERPAAGLAAGLSPLSLILPAGVLTRRVGWSWPCAFLVPFMFPVFLYALLNSTLVTLRQGGIRWRDTFYSLDRLRAGTVR